MLYIALSSDNYSKSYQNDLNSALKYTIVYFLHKKTYICIEKSVIMHYITLIKTIKERREMLQVTQETLAELSEVGLRTLKQFESGKANPTLKTLQKLSDVLGMEVCLKVKKLNTNP